MKLFGPLMQNTIFSQIIYHILYMSRENSMISAIPVRPAAEIVESSLYLSNKRLSIQYVFIAVKILYFGYRDFGESLCWLQF